MAIRTSKIASVLDSADPAKIQPSDLNLGSMPIVAAHLDLRAEITGTSPNRFLRILLYDDVSGDWQVMVERVI